MGAIQFSGPSQTIELSAVEPHGALTSQRCCDERMIVAVKLSVRKIANTVPSMALRKVLQIRKVRSRRNNNAVGEDRLRRSTNVAGAENAVTLYEDCRRSDPSGCHFNLNELNGPQGWTSRRVTVRPCPVRSSIYGCTGPSRLAKKRLENRSDLDGGRFQNVTEDVPVKRFFVDCVSVICIFLGCST